MRNVNGPFLYGRRTKITAVPSFTRLITFIMNSLCFPHIVTRLNSNFVVNLLQSRQLMKLSFVFAVMIEYQCLL
jgi:hypothetical protein